MSSYPVPEILAFLTKIGCKGHFVLAMEVDELDQSSDGFQCEVT